MLGKPRMDFRPPREILYWEKPHETASESGEINDTKIHVLCCIIIVRKRSTIRGCYVDFVIISLFDVDPKGLMDLW